MKSWQEVYGHYPRMPYCSDIRNQEEWLQQLEMGVVKAVPKRNMEEISEQLIAGDFILLWRIQFGTFTNQSSFPKYFEYTYGIDAQQQLEFLQQNGFVVQDTAVESLRHLSAPQLKMLLKAKNVVGLSKMRRQDLDEAMKQVYTEQELATLFTTRGFSLTAKGQKILAEHPEVIERHPQKKF